MTTIYTFHAAEDHSILGSATPENLQQVARQLASNLTGHNDTTKRIYCHNGKGVIAAGITRQGIWHDALREDYAPFGQKAKTVRANAGYHTED